MTVLVDLDAVPGWKLRELADARLDQERRRAEQRCADLGEVFWRLVQAAQILREEFPHLDQETITSAIELRALRLGLHIPDAHAALAVAA